MSKLSGYVCVYVYDYELYKDLQIKFYDLAYTLKQCIARFWILQYMA